MQTVTVQEKIIKLPPYLLKKLEDYLDFLLNEYHSPVKPEPAGLFGICRGEIETIGDIVSPLEIEWEVLK